MSEFHPTIQDSMVDCLFINPRDLVGAVPYVKSLSHAALLRREGIRVQMIDPAPKNLSHGEILYLIKEYNPRIICISAFPSTLPDAYQTVQLIRDKFPHITIVLEGYHVNADPEIILHMGVDYGLLGDSEFAFLKLCKSILTNSYIEIDSEGLAINQDGKLLVNKPAVINEINDLPIPAFDLLPIGKYFSASTNKKIMYLFTTRGCPYDCNFCTIPTQRNYRYLTVENALKQIDYLVNELGVEWIEFMDLTFTISKKRTLELCYAIIAANINFEWGCETRADLLDNEILKVMRLAGCNKITIGVEAGNEAIRYKTGKKINNSVFYQVFELCRKHNIKTMANFILGHPGETEEQINESINMAIALKPFNVFFARMTPLPDIEIYLEGIKKKEIDSDIWIKYMRGETGHPVYYTPSIQKERLQALYRKAFINYYFTWHALKNYFPMFLNIRYLFQSLKIFNRIAFGEPVFK